MIGKSIVGRAFYGVFRYTLDEGEPEEDQEKDAHIIGGNMAGRDAKELSSEVRLYRQRRSDIDKPVWHVTIAFHPDEHLNDAEMQQACIHFLDKMGLDRNHHQYVIIRHHDQAHDHAHIIVNRISDEGKLFDLHRDRPRVKAATRQTEWDLDLRITVEKDEQFRADLRQMIDQVAERNRTLSTFALGLENQGITPRFVYRDGQLHGICYKRQGTEVTGSKLGREYSLPGLQKHQGIDYQAERDGPFIKGRYVEHSPEKASGDTRDFLRRAILQAAQQHPTLSGFCQALDRQGIHPEFALRRGTLSKLNYYYGDQRASGVQLGEEFTFKGLQQSLSVDYQPERDDPVVKAQFLKQGRRKQRQKPVVQPEPRRRVVVPLPQPEVLPQRSRQPDIEWER